MSHTERLRRSPNAFRQLTGITPAAFDRLLADLTPRYEQAEARRKDRPGRRAQARGRAQARPRPGRPPADAPDLLPDLRHPRLPRLPLRRRRLGRGPQHQPAPAAAGRHLPHPRAADRARPGGDPRAVLRRHRAADPPARARASGSSTRARRSGTRSRTRWSSPAAPSRPAPGKKPQRLRIAAVSESFPGSVHDKKVYDRTRVVRPARCEADGGHGLPRDAAGDARPASPGGAS